MQISQNSLQNLQLQKSYEDKHPKKVDKLSKRKRSQDLDKFKENCEKLKSKKPNREMLKGRVNKAVESVDDLHNINNSSIPKTFIYNVAEIPGLLDESPEEHYGDKEHEIRFQIVHRTKSDCKNVIRNWTKDDVKRFRSAHKKFRMQQNENDRDMIAFLKRHLRNKTTEEIVEYLSLCLEPDEDKHPSSRQSVNIFEVELKANRTKE